MTIRTFFTDKDILRTLLTAAAIPLVTWLCTLAFAAYDKAVNEESKEVARRQAATMADVDKVTALMPYLAGSEEERKFARPILGAVASSAEGNALSKTMFDSLDNLLRRELDDPSKQQSSIAKLEELNASRQPLVLDQEPPAEKSIAPTPGAALVRASLVYCQVYGPDQVSKAQAVAERLRQNGIPVPGIEDMVGTHPDSYMKYPQREVIAVRYFKATDEAAALSVAQLVRDTVGPSTNVRLQDLSERKLSVRDGLVELWWPCGSECNRPTGGG